MLQPLQIIYRSTDRAKTTRRNFVDMLRRAAVVFRNCFQGRVRENATILKFRRLTNRRNRRRLRLLRIVGRGRSSKLGPACSFALFPRFGLANILYFYKEVGPNVYQSFQGLTRRCKRDAGVGEPRPGRRHVSKTKNSPTSRV